MSTGGGNTMNTPLDSGHWTDKSFQDRRRFSAGYEACPIGSGGFLGAIQLAGKEKRKEERNETDPSQGGEATGR
jgi:hypothetical protein